MKLKTTSKISLRFTIFNIIILLIFGFSVNAIYYFIWEEDETEDIIKKVENIYNSSDNKKSFKNNILKNGGYIKYNGKTYISDNFKKYYQENKVNYLKIFKKENNYFLYHKIKNKYGVEEVTIFYNITEYISSQKIIIYTVSSLIIILGLFSYLFSIFFTRKAFNKVKQISDFSKNISLYNTNKKIEFELPKNDEIKILSKNLNEAMNRLEDQANKLKHFSSDVAHEIKTPLMLINSRIELSLLKNDERNGLLEIQEKVNNLNNLIETLLMINRMDPHNIKTNIEEINIKDFINDMVSSFENKYKSKNIKVILDIDKNESLKTDKGLFYILLSNLLDNAFKYCEKSGTVEISYKKGEFVISNTGKGISNENLDKIWDTFWKEDSSRTQNESYGLGLSLVKKVLNILNYKVEINSEENKTSFILLVSNHD